MLQLHLNPLVLRPMSLGCNKTIDFIFADKCKHCGQFFNQFSAYKECEQTAHRDGVIYMQVLQKVL